MRDRRLEIQFRGKAARCIATLALRPGDADVETDNVRPIQIARGAAEAARVQKRVPGLQHQHIVAARQREPLVQRFGNPRIGFADPSDGRVETLEPVRRAIGRGAVDHHMLAIGEILHGHAVDRAGERRARIQRGGQHRDAGQIGIGRVHAGGIARPGTQANPARLPGRATAIH
jgi:hypothetical protein